METAALASEGSSVAMLIVSRWRPASVFVVVTGDPVAGRYVKVRSAGVSVGFATSTNVVKKLPVAPSARSQCVDGAVAPADAWPPLQNGDVPKYIARSAAPG